MIFDFLKSKFLKDISIVLTGTSVAQLIPIVSAPVVSRLFTPEEFGSFALYLALVSVLTIIVTARYELTILLPEQDSDAFNIVVATLKISALMCLCIYIMLFFIKWCFFSHISEYWDQVSSWYWVLPVSVLLTGIYQSLAAWMNRRKKFITLSQGKVIQSVSRTLLQTVLGYVGLSVKGLVLSDLVSRVALLLVFLKQTLADWRALKPSIKESTQRDMLRRYYRFPLLQVPSSLLNVGAHQIPNFLFLPFFSATYAGYYFMTQRLLQVPVSLMSTAVLEVFKQRVSHCYNLGRPIRSIYLKTLFILLCISVPPSIIVFFIIEDLFAWFLGEPWRVAGTYSKILLPAMIMRMVVSPLSYTLILAEKHTLNLLGMLMIFVSMLSGFYLLDNALDIVRWISGVFCISYLYYFIVSATIAGVFNRRW